jgi:hypothetical protein
MFQILTYAAQCDLKLPSCGQCVRTGRTCAGYRDLEALQFRHEVNSESHIPTKVSSHTVPRERASPPAKPISSFPLEQQKAPFSNPPELCALPDASTRFFAWSFPFSDMGAVLLSFNDYIPDDTSRPLRKLYSEAPSDSALSNIITAIRVAGLSEVTEQPRLMTTANAKYAEALASIHSALRDAEKAKADETLLVVLLLGLYEEVRITSLGWCEQILTLTSTTLLPSR